MPLRRIIIPEDICGKCSTSHEKTAVPEDRGTAVFLFILFAKVTDQMLTADRRKSDESSGSKPSNALGIGGFRVFVVLIA